MELNEGKMYFVQKATTATLLCRGQKISTCCLSMLKGMCSCSSWICSSGNSGLSFTVQGFADNVITSQQKSALNGIYPLEVKVTVKSSCGMSFPIFSVAVKFLQPQIK